LVRNPEDIKQDEQRVLDRAKAGDSDAFGELVILYQASVRGFISRFISNADDVFDLAQEVFLEAYGSLERYEPAYDFRKWLSGIAMNVIRQHFRTESRRMSRERRAFEEALNRWHMESLDPSTDAEARRERLRQCVEKLETRQAELVRSYYFKGETLESLSALLGKTARALSMQMMRIRGVLAQCIEKGVATNP
jgi:RNA polymerase sigma-70 factor (ECF subfamily)